MRFEELIARNLAAAWLAGPWTEAGLFERGQEVIGKAGRRRFLKLVRAAMQAAPSDYPPSPGWITAFLRERDGLLDYTERFLNSRRSISLALEPAHFSSSLSLALLDVPRLETPQDLAVWIGVPIKHLDWLADSRRQAYSTEIPMLQNYRYAFVPKRTGSTRLLECPKPLLMAAQRKILSSILDKIRAHDAAHGFVAGRSSLSGASRHAGEDIVIALDLKDFFLTTPVRRVHGIFRALGYPWAVARLLTGLCTSAVPQSVFRRLPPAERHDWKTRQLFNSRHLPQGAPTSPALANLAAYRFDVRLTGLARSLDAAYTRYADDLAFSGPLTDRNAQKILATVRAIARDEGYEVHPSKQRAPVRHGRRGQLPRQRATRGLRPVESHPAQLCEAWSSIAEPGWSCRFPRPPRRPRHLGREREPEPGSEIAPPVRCDRLEGRERGRDRSRSTRWPGSVAHHRREALGSRAK